MSGTVPIEWYDREAEKVKFWMVKAQDTERQLAEKDAAGRALLSILKEYRSSHHWQDEMAEALADCPPEWKV